MKPCPFCGGNATAIFLSPSSSDYYEAWIVRCSFCSALGPEASTKENAVTKWNTREVK